MAVTEVYGCDWCGNIVPKRQHDGKPLFAAHITAKAGMELGPTDYDICAACLNAFQAITKGKYRR